MSDYVSKKRPSGSGERAQGLPPTHADRQTGDNNYMQDFGDMDLPRYKPPTPDNRPPRNPRAKSPVDPGWGTEVEYEEWTPPTRRRRLNPIAAQFVPAQKPKKGAQFTPINKTPKKGAQFTPINNDDEELGFNQNFFAGGGQFERQENVTQIEPEYVDGEALFSALEELPDKKPGLDTAIQQKYNISEACFIGHGGEGEVYATKDHNGKVFAAKFIKQPKYFVTGRPPNEIEQLERMGLGPSSMNTHPNILKILDWYPPVNASPDCAYIMEFCPLDDLEKWTWAHFHALWNNQDRPHEALLRSVFIDLLNGLEFLHAPVTPWGQSKPRIIHGDIKPANILLVANHRLPGHWAYAVPTAKLADFGGATAIPPAFTRQHTRGMRHVYTQNWAPPQALPAELPDGHHRWTAPDIMRRLRPSTDVYSAAASVGYLMTGFAARKGGGYDVDRPERKWDRAREAALKWWERNAELVTRPHLLPPTVRPGMDGKAPQPSLEQKRRTFLKARSAKRSNPKHGFTWPRAVYSRELLAALDKGYQVDAKKRASARELLRELEHGFQQHMLDLMNGRG